MCGGLRVHHVKVKPGASIKYKTLAGERTGIWGLGEGLGAYNARMENLNTTWANMSGSRGILTVDSFEENGGTFRVKGEPTLLAGIFDISGDFVLLTRPARDGVEKFHHRMPVIIQHEKQWLEDGQLPGDTGRTEVELISVLREDPRRRWLQSL